MKAPIRFANHADEGWDVFIDGKDAGHVFQDDSEGRARLWRAAIWIPEAGECAHGIAPTRKAAVEAAMIEGGIA
jgi:hypothetical protein